MLVPKAALILGDYLFEEQIVALSLRRTQAPALDRLEVVLPASQSLAAGVGDTCNLTLDSGDVGALDGGDAEVFAGVITAISRRGSVSVVQAHNGGRALAQYRPVGAFEQIGLDEVLTTLCSDVGVDVVVDLDAPILALYAVNGRASALQEVARLAALAGGSAAFDGAGLLHVTSAGGPDSEVALRYGRELLHIDVADGAAPADGLTVVGEGAGAPGAPEARWLTTDFLQGSGSDPGPDARRRAIPELRDQGDTDAAALALQQARSAAAQPVRIKTWLMPALAPGMRIEVADLPDHVALTDCRVTQVVSTLHAGGTASSAVWARAQPADGGVPGGLL